MAIEEIQSIILAISRFISLILVFVTVLFGIRYPQVQADIKEEIPAGQKAKDRLRARLSKRLYIDMAPMLLITFFSSYLFLPLMIRIFNAYEFKLWDFDIVITAFVFITICIWFFFGWALLLSLKLMLRINKCKSGDDAPA